MSTTRTFAPDATIIVDAWRLNTTQEICRRETWAYQPEITVGDLLCTSVVRQRYADREAYVISPWRCRAVAFPDVDSAIVALTLGLEP